MGLFKLVSLKRFDEIKKSCEEIVKNIDNKLENLPKIKTCKYSHVPERLWCDRYNCAPIKRCSSCFGYDKEESLGK